MVTHRIGPIDVGASHGGDPKDPNDRIYNDGPLATQGLGVTEQGTRDHYANASNHRTNNMMC